MPGLSVYCKSLRARLLGRGKHKGVVCVFHNMLHYMYIYIYMYTRRARLLAATLYVSAAS